MGQSSPHVILSRIHDITLHSLYNFKTFMGKTDKKCPFFTQNHAVFNI